MKIKLVIFDIKTEPKEGPENGWRWFMEPARKITLAKTELSLSPPPHFVRETMDIWTVGDILTFLNTLQHKDVKQDEVLFISDDEDFVSVVSGVGMHCISVAPAKNGDISYPAPITGDRIIGRILYIEHMTGKK